MREKIRDLFLLQEKAVKNGQPDYAARIDNLKKLRTAILYYEEEIYEALYKDLHKSRFEAYATEIGFVLEELNFHLKHLRKWMRPHRVSTPVVNFPAKSFYTYEPKGKVLIISPWNYPFHLMIAPLIGALSAGDRVVLKPSEISANTSALLEKIINTTFDPATVKLFTGGVDVSQELLKLPFDHVFFTGSPRVGKIVMQHAAKNMTPVTLELGGKSPCIVDENANLKLAARRIAWGKLINAGQTCIAPDYFLVHKSVKKLFLDLLKDAVEKMYGPDTLNNKDYPRIITKANVERLKTLTEGAEIYYGGKYNIEERWFSPTVLNNVTFDMPVMGQEIFGPLFPVITFDDYGEIIEKINSRPKPLALYLFTDNKRLQNRILKEISSGGVSINDTLVHIVSPKLPFGGIGNSGTGKYHGKYSFELFSNVKSVVKRAVWPDVPVRYAPFQSWKYKIIKFIMR
jgi:aldehyde dehydrogenase (NAD+)